MSKRRLFSILLIICTFKMCYSDWVSEWMTPIRDLYSSNNSPVRRYNKMNMKVLDSEKIKIPEDTEAFELPKKNLLFPSTPITTPREQSPNLKVILESVLHNAKRLADSLKSQIMAVEEKERALKEAIVNGRFGVTALTVSTIRMLPRNYIIRDGFWTQCNGIVQFPTLPKSDTAAVFSDIYSAPRCIGREVASRPDRCVFNSVIKYETLPTRRSSEYSEDDYLCLKSNFNNTLEQYSSVTKRLVDQTCKNGEIRSLDDNASECGFKVISEYTYYPNKHSATHLPLDYCESVIGSCKLIVAWHLSNSSIENFEYMKDDQNFKNYFMKSETVGNIAFY